jgi:hypothetical protein
VEPRFSDCSDTEPTQAAKDVVVSRDKLIDIFERIGSFFRRLEEYVEVPTTEAMKDIIVKIMVEALGIFGIVTKEMKEGRASELIPDDAFHMADSISEKYLKNLFGRRDIEDALSRLDRMTQEMARMATAQLREVAHNVDDGFKTVGKGVEGVDDKVNDVDNKVNLVIEGTFSALTTRTCHRKPTHD